jgi:hypothetical protein
MKKTHPFRACRSAIPWLVLLTSLALPCSWLRAAPSQSEVFKSIQNSMEQSQTFDYRPVLLVVAGGGVVALLLMVSSRRQNSKRKPGPVNAPARLMKELLREIPLNAAELKQLKVMAAAVEAPGHEQTNPLVLLLCPSVMAKGLHRAGNKVDRKTVALIVRKLREGK